MSEVQSAGTPLPDGPVGRALVGTCKVFAMAGALVFVGIVVMSVISITGRKLFSHPIQGDAEFYVDAFARYAFRRIPWLSERIRVQAMKEARVQMAQGADQMRAGARQMREEAARLRDPAYRANREDMQILLWPLFYTSFMVEDFLDDNANFGATTTVISSALVTWQAQRSSPGLAGFLNESSSHGANHLISHNPSAVRGGLDPITTRVRFPGGARNQARMDATCDSMNSPSPRFYAEIFNRTSPKGNFLQADSSVMCK